MPEDKPWDEFPSWIRDVQRALRVVRRQLKRARYADTARLVAAVRYYLKVFRTFVRRSDVLRAYATEHAAEAGSSTEKLLEMVRESERLERQQSYSLSTWLEQMTALLERRAALDRKVLDSFQATRRAARSSRGKTIPLKKTSHRLFEWLRTAPSEAAEEFEKTIRQEILAAKEAATEFRRAAEQTVDASVEQVRANRQSRRH